ncbi:hypothetical protein JM18_004320 [Phytophthora kernoviae]|uniref:Uncharacterized protein n=2 Tax=Phytophthora kernoviae TaxID=325452 RepID=A0A8T0LTK5_9STRA|nr:hypothetical protein G195_005995 [Phytophthora kernoviae 00238/432]KAG2519900.1 hypothetical protein JM16_005198 [Phytophthora kernoviae]KAG2526150.1 hypothetical protein JM18_004320 [Phytophthora kernoviae]
MCRCSAKLALEEYVDLSNSIIPGATASEYIECFHDLLNGACDDANSISSTFQRHKDNAFQLEMAVKIQVLKRSCVAKYSFLMEPISVERIDVLESKMRDLQEEMKGLRLKAVSGQNSAVLELQNEMAKLRGDLDGRVKLISDLRGKMNALCADNGRFDVIHTQGMRLNRNLILWDQTGSKNVVSADGTIKGLDPGTYLVMVVVNYYGGEVRLMKNSIVHCTQNSLAKISYLTLARISE